MARDYRNEYAMSNKISIHYRPYRPSGYTDDLGIIADTNQWIPAQEAGWYVTVPMGYTISDIVDWLDESGIDYAMKATVYFQTHFVIFNESDANLFALRWLNDTV